MYHETYMSKKTIFFDIYVLSRAISFLTFFSRAISFLTYMSHDTYGVSFDTSHVYHIYEKLRAARWY